MKPAVTAVVPVQGRSKTAHETISTRSTSEVAGGRLARAASDLQGASLASQDVQRQELPGGEGRPRELRLAQPGKVILVVPGSPRSRYNRRRTCAVPLRPGSDDRGVACLVLRAPIHPRPKRSQAHAQLLPADVIFSRSLCRPSCSTTSLPDDALRRLLCRLGSPDPSHSFEPPASTQPSQLSPVVPFPRFRLPDLAAPPPRVPPCRHAPVSTTRCDTPAKLYPARPRTLALRPRLARHLYFAARRILGSPPRSTATCTPLLAPHTATECRATAAVCAGRDRRMSG